MSWFNLQLEPGRLGNKSLREGGCYHGLKSNFDTHKNESLAIIGQTFTIESGKINNKALLILSIIYRIHIDSTYKTI